MSNPILPRRMPDGDFCCGRCGDDDLTCIDDSRPDDRSSWICRRCAFGNHCNLPEPMLDAYKAIIDGLVQSEFNVQANRIVRKIDDLREMISAFVDTHGPTCSCSHCVTDPSNSHSTYLDLRGLLWVLDVGHGCASSCIRLLRENVPLPDADDDAETAACIEALRQKRPSIDDTADEPVAIVAPAAPVRFREFL